MEWDGIRWIPPNQSTDIPWDVSTNAIEFKIDSLPQPFRLVDELIQSIVREAVTIADAKETVFSMNSSPICAPLNSCLMDGLGVVTAQVFSKDGGFILLGTDTGCVYVLQTNLGYAPGVIKSYFKLPGTQVSAVASLHMVPLEVNDDVSGVNPCYRLVAASDKQMWILEINVHTYVYEVTFAGKLPVDRGAFQSNGFLLSPCGGLLACTFVDNSVTLFKLAQVSVLPSSMKAAQIVKIGADGKLGKKAPEKAKDSVSAATNSRSTSRIDVKGQSQPVVADGPWAGPFTSVASGVPEHRPRTGSSFFELKTLILSIPPKHLQLALSRGVQTKAHVLLLSLPGERRFGSPATSRTRSMVVWHTGSSLVSLYALLDKKLSSGTDPDPVAAGRPTRNFNSVIGMLNFLCLYFCATAPARQWPLPDVVTVLDKHKIHT